MIINLHDSLLFLLLCSWCKDYLLQDNVQSEWYCCYAVVIVTKRSCYIDSKRRLQPGNQLGHSTRSSCCITISYLKFTQVDALCYKWIASSSSTETVYCISKLWYNLQLSSSPNLKPSDVTSLFPSSTFWFPSINLFMSFY